MLDLTGEFSEAAPFLASVILNVPILDLTAPTQDQLALAAAFIADHQSRGTVYVHCKIGYSARGGRRRLSPGQRAGRHGGGSPDRLRRSGPRSSSGPKRWSPCSPSSEGRRRPHLCADDRFRLAHRGWGSAAGDPLAPR